MRHQIPPAEDVMLAAVAVVRAQGLLGPRPSAEGQHDAALAAVLPYLERAGSMTGPVLAADPALCLLIAQLGAMAAGALLAMSDPGGSGMNPEAVLALLGDRLDDVEQKILSRCRAEPSEEL